MQLVGEFGFSSSPDRTEPLIDMGCAADSGTRKGRVGTHSESNDIGNDAVSQFARNVAACDGCRKPLESSGSEENQRDRP